MPAKPGFWYSRTIHFHETDAAGVLYFANGLVLCHEAYEASLAKAGVTLRTFFSRDSETAYPIVHAEIDFRRPLLCGDPVLVGGMPQVLDDSSFEIHFQIRDLADTQTLVEARTRHVCIATNERQRRPLPPMIQHWIEDCRTNLTV